MHSPAFWTVIGDPSGMVMPASFRARAKSVLPSGPNDRAHISKAASSKLDGHPIANSRDLSFNVSNGGFPS